MTAKAEWDGEERRTSLCSLHSKQLHELHTTVHGNGDPKKGMLWKIEEIDDFVRSIKGVFWKCFPIALGGALSAIGMFIMQIIKLLTEHGKI